MVDVIPDLIGVGLPSAHCLYIDDDWGFLRYVRTKLKLVSSNKHIAASESEKYTMFLGRSSHNKMIVYSTAQSKSRIKQLF